MIVVSRRGEGARRADEGPILFAMKRIALVPFLLLALAGCGNKGPLVRPPSPADETSVPATTAPVPATTAPAASVEPAAAPPVDGGG